jgi:hypothetical protein
LERVGLGEVGEVVGEGLLEEAAQGVGGGEVSLVEREGEEGVSVDDLKAVRELLGGGEGHAGEEEGGVVVGDGEAGALGEGAEEAAAVAGLSLDPGEVGDAALAGGAGVVGHAVEDEAVEAVGGPGVGDAERLEEEDGLLEEAGPVGGALEGGVVVEASLRGDPVEDEVAEGVGFALGEGEAVGLRKV